MGVPFFLPFIFTIRVLARLIYGMMYRTLLIGEDITRGLVMQSAVKHLIMTNLKTINKTNTMKKTLLLILFSVAIATLNAQTQKNARVKEYTRPAFAFTASNSMYLEKISIDKNCTELYFSATEPEKLPDLETPIYLVAGNNRIPYVDAFVSENKDSVKLVFRALPASAVTFDLIGFDKGGTEYEQTVKDIYRQNRTSAMIFLLMNHCRNMKPLAIPLML